MKRQATGRFNRICKSRSLFQLPPWQGDQLLGHQAEQFVPIEVLVTDIPRVETQVVTGPLNSWHMAAPEFITAKPDPTAHVFVDVEYLAITVMFPSASTDACPKPLADVQEIVLFRRGQNTP